MTKTIYNFNPHTGEFLNEAPADESPLEPGVILLPAFATTATPPKTATREVAVFTGGKWQVKADWRGVALFSTNDGNAMSIVEIGKTPADVGATDKAMPSAAHSWKDGAWVLDPVKVASEQSAGKVSKWESIKAERERRKSGGVKVGSKWFHSDDGSRIQQMGLVMMGASIPANLQWKTMDGTFITMTQTLASQVFQAVAASDQAIFIAAETHRVAMEASADPASYDFSAGWPKSFGE